MPGTFSCLTFHVVFSTTYRLPLITRDIREGIYPYIALMGSAYWFGYFLIILPLLGVIEKPLRPPATIEDDFNDHYGKPKSDADGGSVASPAE